MIANRGISLVKGHVLLKNQSLLRCLGLAARSAVSRGESCAGRTGRQVCLRQVGCNAAGRLLLSHFRLAAARRFKAGATASWAAR